MRFEGRLVLFNDETFKRTVFTPETKILYLGENLRRFEGRVPFVFEWQAEKVIGYVDAFIFDEDGIIVKGDITYDLFFDAVKEVDQIGIGATWTILESHSDPSGSKILDTLQLIYISTKFNVEKDDKRLMRLED